MFNNLPFTVTNGLDSWPILQVGISWRFQNNDISWEILELFLALRNAQAIVSELESHVLQIIINSNEEGQNFLNFKVVHAICWRHLNLELVEV